MDYTSYVKLILIFIVSANLIAAEHWEVNTIACRDTDSDVRTQLLQCPSSIIKIDSDIYVTDTWNHRIRKFVFDGTKWNASTIAGGNRYGFKDDTSTAALFAYPYGITNIGQDIYIADSNNNAIRKLAFDNAQQLWHVTTIAGDGSRNFSDGTGSHAKFDRPCGITSDNIGNLYVADYNNHRICQLVFDGTKKMWNVTTIAGSNCGFADGEGHNAKFNHPHGIAADNAGNLYVTDYDNHRVRKLVFDGTKKMWNVTTIAGSNYGFADGEGHNAKFNHPHGITSDNIGNLYIADTWNHRIRELVFDGTKKIWDVTTIAGSHYGFVDGDRDGAQFNNPYGITSTDKDIYVIDMGNNIVRNLTKKI